jgi:chorismate-pyruvate lyase
LGPLLYPLDEFYELSRLPLPTVVPVEPNEIPELYRGLLVHDRDMTPTLERAHGGRIELRVLQYSVRENLLSRQIALTVNGGDQAVTFGAIKIYLERFPPAAQSLILEMKQPLGAILRSQEIAHSSRPSPYFRVEADATIRTALQLNGSATLYGRQNMLLDSAGNTLARVLEILRP